ncbi:MAG: DUF302 domain-containing protein, partial [OCS116 cluster bacterium]|nr:DUF302 domain-containing protein [OCS116 cluster bacterium]
MFKRIFFISSMLVTSSFALAADGLISVKSQNNVNDTAAKLVKILESKNMTVFTT